jgi:dolichyl-phosphate beta-glucosyltransferase
MSRIELSIVIPVFNEENRVVDTLVQSETYLKSKRIQAEMIVVDDGSSDRTIPVVEDFRKKRKLSKRLRIIRQPINRGKGAAVKAGVMAAQGQVVLYMDADNSTPLSEYEKFRGLLEKGTDVVVGSRAVDRSLVKVHQPFYREAMGRIFNLFVQAVAIPGVQDTQCGFKAFRRTAARAIFPLQTIERFGFDVEVLYIARKKGFQISETPVHWINSPYSKVHVFRDSLEMLTDLIVIRLNDWKGLYYSPNASVKVKA